MARPDLTWRIGTIGFAYAPWRGVFYPAHVKPPQQLSYYASKFDAVELDTTFHAMPTPERVRVWADQVDDAFRFCVKAPKFVTHEDQLDRKADLLKVFIDTVQELGPKLGAILLQFPATFDPAKAGALLKLIDATRSPVPLAVEVRHRGWFDQHAIQAVADRGVAVVSNDYLDQTQPIIPQPTVYVRLIGEHDRYPLKNQEEADVEERLTWWVKRIEDKAPLGATVWVFTNNDYAGYSIGTSQRLRRLVGLPDRPRQEHPLRTLFD